MDKSEQLKDALKAIEKKHFKKVSQNRESFQDITMRGGNPFEYGQKTDEELLNETITETYSLGKKDGKLEVIGELEMEFKNELTKEEDSTFWDGFNEAYSLLKSKLTQLKESIK